MQLLTPVDIPAQSLEIDTARLKALFERKLLTLEGYVLLAIDMSYSGRSSVSVHTESFCKQWKLKPYEFSSAIAKLQKKNLIDCKAEANVQLELFDLEEAD
jgi:hypothetical protein